MIKNGRNYRKLFQNLEKKSSSYGSLSSFRTVLEKKKKNNAKVLLKMNAK